MSPNKKLQISDIYTETKLWYDTRCCVSHRSSRCKCSKFNYGIIYPNKSLIPVSNIGHKLVIHNNTKLLKCLENSKGVWDGKQTLKYQLEAEFCKICTVLILFFFLSRIEVYNPRQLWINIIIFRNERHPPESACPPLSPPADQQR